ncbi:MULTISPECIES: protein kinase domain-containing protein [unclassified Caballeronia]|uniref:serine/threonine protein kinase n=1 Tax=unclassified Caballeronia TaxID=2646786 RepID=UPI00285DCD2D|nr:MULTISPECIES: protein kinase [unclassified Caballeronia]MDR5754020.1 protein kinase [Caballeronia sp. LZ024]MDR5840399.1 protein kinase [Caballeronia sp. LZ031]
MTSFPEAIRTFHSDDPSRDAFLAEIDSALADTREPHSRLIAILDEAHAARPLPPDVYAAVKRRIDEASLSAPQRNLHPATPDNADETRVQTTPAGFTPRDSSGQASFGNGQVVAELDQVKGVGDTLNGRFVLEECLGIGGMGTVYKALDLRKLEASDRRPYVAIKVLNLQFRGNPKSLIALQREARKAQTLAHRNIVTVYDFDRDGSVVYLTMEYLSGQPLSRLLRNPNFKGMPFAEVFPIFKGMANALAYAHERGFVHCDFKPANVFLTDTAEVKVIDFGIARVFQRPEEETEATIFDPGSLGALTPAYASPEMLEHREPDPRDDVYALGCITYELLTGKHPFDRVPATQARSAGMKPARPDDLGNKQWKAIRAALSFDREARTPTVAQFSDELAEEQRPAATAGSKGRPKLMFGAAALVAAVVAGGGYYFYDQSRSEQEGAKGAQETDVAGSVVAPSAPAVAVVPSAPAAASAPATALTLDAVTPALAAVPCSALVATVHDQTVDVQGYVSERYGMGRLRQALGALPGVKTVNLGVQAVAEDKCDVLKVVGPYWTANHQTGRPASLRSRAPGARLTEGQPLIVDVMTPGFDSYVNVDYFQLDGTVVHLVPNERAKDNQAPPHYTATIGTMGDWVVGKPFGSELIVLFITPAPLFDSLRPDSEPKADYLRAVDARLAQLAGKYGRDHVAVDIVQISTQARKH